MMGSAGTLEPSSAGTLPNRLEADQVPVGSLPNPSVGDQKVDVADHLLAHISSNPLITRPRDGSSGRPQALVQYLASLGRTREMELDLVLPGHGEPITHHRPLIDERFALHRRRADKLHRRISERPRTAYELAQSLWGNIAVTQAFLTLSEVLGHTDILVNERRVREVERDGVGVFEAA